MNKPKITEAKCFEQVAKVIGPKNAEREIFIASQRESANFDHKADLIGAFRWSVSPQGFSFWGSIADEIDLMENDYYSK